MARDDIDVPESWRDALDGDDGPPSKIAEILPDLLSPAARPAGGLERLLQAVSQPPLRYAPFFDRVATLWDVPKQDVTAAFERTRTLAGWKRTPLPGVRVIEVAGGPRTLGGSTFLVR